MGNPYPYEGSADELPQHKVQLKSFLIDVYEVPYYYYSRIREWGLTNGYPDLVSGLCGYSVKGNKLSGDHPVVGLTWFDCIKWCNARSEYEGLTPVYYTDKMQTNVYRVGMVMVDNHCIDARADGYRLPTEAEWECAARGPVKARRFPFGEKFNLEYLNAKDSGDPFDNGTTPVGFYKGKLNDYGLYDVIGNAFEWCWDWFGKYPSEELVESPMGPLTGEYKVLRGGSWNSSFPFFFRCSYRHYYKPHETTPSFGFRCVRSFY
jgi:formylglycine-generating enzyme required for sulfatase activity